MDVVINLEVEPVTCGKELVRPLLAEDKGGEILIGASTEGEELLAG